MGVGSKSDIRSIMSPITLAPAKKNPWRNPMLRNVVSPAYDSTDTVNYRFGFFSDNDANAPTSNTTWLAVDDNIGNELNANMIALNPWNVEPGNKTITRVGYHGAFHGAEGGINATFVEVWRKNGTDLERVAVSEDLGVITATAYRCYRADPSGGLSVTIEDGYSYFYGIRVIRNANAGQPYFGLTIDTDFTLDRYTIGLSAAYDLSSAVPIAGSGASPYANVVTGKDHHNMFVEYSSDAYIEFELTGVLSGKYSIPSCRDEPYVIQADGLAVANGNVFTMLSQRVPTGTGTTVLDNTTQMDMGNGSPGINNMVYNGNTTNLPNLAASQAGRVFDLLWSYRVPAGTGDLSWQNMELEDAIHFHAPANGSRGDVYSSIEPPDFVTLTGFASAAKLIVGVRPTINVGDSQCISGSGISQRTLNTDRWGGLSAALTKPRIAIIFGASGKTLNGILSDIWNGTAGSVDGIELCGLGALWFFAGVGVNDASAIPEDGSGGSYELARGMVQQLKTDLSTMLKEIMENGDDVLLAGLPPYSSTASADKYEAFCVRHWNRELLGAALSLEVPFYNPWPDMVVAGTENNDIPEFNPDYHTGDDGTHLDATGGAVAIAGAKAAFENGTIDLRDAWD